MVAVSDVPAEFLDRLRPACLGLPEAFEERAWVGIRWKVRTRTFAHVLLVEGGRPPSYARAAGDDGPVVLLTFRAAGDEVGALRRTGPPFFAPPWGGDLVGLALGPDTDWTEVGELLTESYCLLAPRKLAALVDRPG